MRHLYDVQFLNKWRKVICNISPVVSASGRKFLQLFNNPDKTRKKIFYRLISQELISEIKLSM